ncbi:hypothetical protein EIN_142010 [Entamoeba invadens IP1]|uniref:PiggyBac transposable element-derived protein domain-containing protein n=1 Tax=Entamoeba invadens IP1 TaxID=370355 RepID=A0A0A1UGZ7_ENTIV|nr:hypothetical protein EIN_142010 [Entamoeba invadens IP1]ELP95309.1 hypothetical protein EIN_142010 [Entamoeba invadens IP1]|eukprot:XP_004262080.1 hypothetical protein EIN_142010 [Entamoeba invadens IP1]
MKFPVDIFNYLCAYYPVPFKSSRCTFALFKNMLEVGMTNVYVISRIFEKNLEHGSFLRELGKSLCEEHIASKFETLDEKDQVKTVSTLKNCQMGIDEAMKTVVSGESERGKCLSCLLAQTKKSSKNRRNKKDVRTVKKCFLCYRPCCKNHSINVCDVCQGKVDIGDDYKEVRKFPAFSKRVRKHYKESKRGSIPDC